MIFKNWFESSIEDLCVIGDLESIIFIYTSEMVLWKIMSVVFLCDFIKEDSDLSAFFHTNAVPTLEIR